MNNENNRDSVEELLKDKSFRNWVINNDPESAAFWKFRLENESNLKQNILFAKHFLLNLQEQPVAISANEIEELAIQITNQAAESKLVFWKSPALRIAASLVILFGFGLLVYNYQNKEKVVANDSSYVKSEVTTKKSNNSRNIEVIVLEDGTKIQLHPNSSIEYPSKFQEKKREVFLVGKAFFDVVKNPEKPFWVHTKKISTQVLGTSFMVKAYNTDEDAQVQVKTGKVSVYLNKDLYQNPNVQKTGIVLAPNQQATLLSKDNRLVKTLVETPSQVIGLPIEDFVFDDVPLKKVLKTIEKSYGITVIFDENKIENCFFTANLTTESLYDKLSIICSISNSTYEIVDAQIIIYSKGCN